MIASMLKHPRTPPPNNVALDYQTADSEQVLKRPRPFGMSEEVHNMPFTLVLSLFFCVRVVYCHSVTWVSLEVLHS